MQDNRKARAVDDVKGLPLRMVRCPRCGFYLLDVYGYNHYLVRVKCRKCKFNETIDTARYRTVRGRGFSPLSGRSGYGRERSE